MACGAALLTGLVNSFARVNQGGCPTAVEIRKGTWFAAGQSQLRRSGIVVETSGLTRAPQSQGQPAARARPALFKPIAEVETTDYADDTDAEAVLSVWSVSSRKRRRSLSSRKVSSRWSLRLIRWQVAPGYWTHQGRSMATIPSHRIPIVNC